MAPRGDLQRRPEIAERYLEKGAKVFLEGKLTTRKWQDQSGADRYSTEIHLTPYNGVLTFLDSRRDGARPSGGEPTGSSAPGADPDDEFRSEAHAGRRPVSAPGAAVPHLHQAALNLGLHGRPPRDLETQINYVRRPDAWQPAEEPAARR